MPGVFRPYSLVDVLGAMNQQGQAQGASMTDGLGDFVEADEQGVLADSATVTHSAPPGWDQTTWGGCAWA